MTSYDYIEHSKKSFWDNNGNENIYSYGCFNQSSHNINVHENNCIIIEFRIKNDYYKAVCVPINNSILNYHRVLSTSYINDNIDYMATILYSYYIFAKEEYSKLKFKNCSINSIILYKQIHKEVVDENNAICNDLLDKLPNYKQIIEDEIQDVSKYSAEVIPTRLSNKPKLNKNKK